MKFLSRVVSGGTARFKTFTEYPHTSHVAQRGEKKIEKRMKQLLLCETLKHLFRITNQNLT